MTTINYAPAGKIAARFHESEAFVRGLMGPVGSSKSSACCVEILKKAMNQKPDSNGVRRTRFAIVRQSYRELETTTLKTWLEWFPAPVSQMKYGSPIIARLNFQLADKTTLDCEVMFFPVERPDEIEKLSSLEITGAWMNECREMPMAVLNKLTERVGRFPPIKVGGPTWRGVIMDTNPPDDDHWWYRLAEGSDRDLKKQMEQIEYELRKRSYLKEGQKLYQFFKQPGGLILESNGTLKENPQAENIANLDGGYAYYFRQAAGKSREWIKSQILGEYASTADGRPVYPEYRDETHCRDLEVDDTLPLLLGFDYGLTPACAICQINTRGQLFILDELFARGMGIRAFARDIVIPHLSTKYSGIPVQACGDPAGVARKDTDEKTCFMELAEAGIPAVPATTNNFAARREAVAYYLTTMVDGEPAFLIDPKAEMIRKGMNGRYKYNRVQVVGEERYRDVPDKNDYSHPCEALQYAALYSRSMQNSNEWSSPIKYPSLGLA